MTADKNSAKSVDSAGDVLESISGIGPKFAEALHNIGIHKFADLAAYTPEALSQALMDQVELRIPPERIEANNWIGQARALVEKPTQPETTVQQEKLEDESAKQTITNEADALMPDAILTLENTSLRIINVQVEEEELNKGHKRLLATVRFRIIGNDAELLAARSIPYLVQIHTINSDSGESTLVASKQSQLQPSVYEYDSSHYVPLPALGQYELQSTVLGLPSFSMTSVHKGPTLAIIP